MDGTKKGTGTRDDNRAFKIAVAGVVIAVIAVVAFNVMAPKDRLQGPSQASTPAMTQGANQTGGPAGDGTTQQAAPQRGDSPTAPGRESVGAPVGAAPGASR
ncbi:MAG: hypothetical protein EOP24_30375 [Hyphomicrobiales bacterium]|nr:MAG: hypothetical protein EOP24_30375 [Hyphomicrobiales bacterium]